MTENNKVNGWNNYETWNFMLWEGDFLQELANEEFEEIESFEGDKKDSYDNIQAIVENHIEMLSEEATQHLTGFASDNMTHTFNAIDIHEIVTHLMSE